jgi:hypothetical protein
MRLPFTFRFERLNTHGQITPSPFRRSCSAFWLDYLEAGQPLCEFLEDFPTVTREQAVAALEQAKEALLARARPA